MGLIAAVDVHAIKPDFTTKWKTGFANCQSKLLKSAELTVDGVYARAFIKTAPSVHHLGTSQWKDIWIDILIWNMKPDSFGFPSEPGFFRFYKSHIFTFLRHAI